MRPLSLSLLVAALAACAGTHAGTAPAPGGSYDVVITGGRLVDGTGDPWTYADVGIRGDRIVRVAPGGALASAPAARRVDAKGLVVAPGFIDIQAQSYDALLTGDGRAISKITQGVTTEILGEGDTPAPVNDKLLAAYTPADSQWVRAIRGFTGPHGFGAWLDAMERHGNAVNVGSFLGAATVRAYAKGQAQGAPTAAELDTMRLVVRDAMEDGAFGVASALIYPPGSYAGTDELVEMAKAMAPYHGVYITHMRSEEDSLLEAMDEALAIGRRGGVPVEIYHLKASGPRNWSKAAAMVAKIDSARAAGQDVGATMYPYPASSNSLAACFPQWASENGKLLANLRDPAMRARIVREATDTTSLAALCQSTGASRIMVLGFTKPELKKYEGWRLDRIAQDMHENWGDAMTDLTLAEDGKLAKITFGMSDENVAMQLRKPWVVIGTDAGALNPDSALSQGLTHPRAYGSYPRILGRYVREQGVLTLEDAIRRMTWGVAQRLSIRDRGLVKEGMYADVVVFDPATVIDRATYEKPHQVSVGIRDVLVNGVAVVKDGTVTGARPGKAVRSVR
jgi:dihydroorotase/N-acyl-D-amino-acid deacylase